MRTFVFETSAGAGGPRKVDIDLPDVRAAQIEAVRPLGELLREDGVELWKDEMGTMTVSDDQGLRQFRLDPSAVRAPSFQDRLGASGAVQRSMNLEPPVA